MGWMNRVRNAVTRHSDKIEKGIDRGARYADRRTGRKHSGKLNSATGKAKGYMNKLKRQQRGRGGH